MNSRSLLKLKSMESVMPVTMVTIIPQAPPLGSGHYLEDSFQMASAKGCHLRNSLNAQGREVGDEPRRREK